MTLPNCLVIGAMRSGTSTLHGLLGQHPDVFMSTPKEPNYFVFAGETQAPLVEASGSVIDDAEYEGIFAEGGDARVRGEASHNYLYYADVTAPRIRDRLPDVKLIAILRNPVDRAYSHYLLHVRNEQETATTFREALDREDLRVGNGEQFGHYVRRGLYARQLPHYLERFPAARFRIYLYEELAADAAALASDAYAFLGVDPTFVPDTSVRSNPSGIPRNRLLHQILVKDNVVKRAVQPLLPSRLYRMGARVRDRNLSHPALDPAVRAELTDVFRSDILALQELIGRDLSGWLE